MSDTHRPGHRKQGSVQTKALAGLVAIMLAAAIVALVFVTSGGGSTKQADARPSDVGRNSNTTSPGRTPSATSTGSGTAPTTSAPSTSTTTPSTATSGTATSGTASRSRSTTSSHSSDTKKVIYTVKKGDTLFDIGRWYSDHGYLKLYNWNKSVIGKNPDLIFPGQRIIVVDGNVGVARKAP